MIGKPLSERYELGRLDPAKAGAILEEILPTQAKPLVEVRAQDAKMVACLVVRADKLALQLCRDLGFDMRPDGTAVFGLLGADAAKLFVRLPDHQRKWLATPCGPRETKVLLVAGGIALLSLETHDGKVAISAVP